MSRGTGHFALGSRPEAPLLSNSATAAAEGMASQRDFQDAYKLYFGSPDPRGSPPLRLDKAAARCLVELPANQHHIGCKALLGWCLVDSRDDVTRGRALIDEAVAAGSAFGAACKGMYYLSINNYTEAAPWLQEAATQGDAFGLFGFGQCHMKGCRGVTENHWEAVRCWRQAANMGLAEAQCYLADCLENGIGTDRNIDDARRWYTQAAEQGHLQAQSYLNDCFESSARRVHVANQDRLGGRHQANALGVAAVRPPGSATSDTPAPRRCCPREVRACSIQ